MGIRWLSHPYNHIFHGAADGQDSSNTLCSLGSLVLVGSGDIELDVK